MIRNSPMIVILLVVLTACEDPVVQQQQFRTAAVERRDIVVTVEAAGVIQPFSTVEVKSKASGEVLSIHTESGDFIEEGMPLVQIDKRVPLNQLALVEAQLEAARSRRTIAEAQLKRAARLFDSRSINEVDYENTVVELANAKADFARARITVENARFALDDTEVNAPISGTVIEKLVEKGQVISSPTTDVGGGTVLMKMADLRTVQVQALVNEIDIGKIRPGQMATVNVSAYPARPFRAEVLKIEPQAMPDQAVTTFKVLLSLANQEHLLRPGMNADIEVLVEERRDVVAVPNAALRTRGDIATTAEIVGVDEFELRQRLEAAETVARDAEPDDHTDNPSRYWVLNAHDDDLQVKVVDTGATDHDYSEVIGGIDEGAQVLILPSSGLVLAQQRLQQNMRRLSSLTGISRDTD